MFILWTPRLSRLRLIDHELKSRIPSHSCWSNNHIPVNSSTHYFSHHTNISRNRIRAKTQAQTFHAKLPGRSTQRLARPSSAMATNGTTVPAMINRALLSKGQRKLLDQYKKPPGWMYGLVRREKEKQQRWRRPGTPFCIGQKQVFLYVSRSGFLLKENVLNAKSFLSWHSPSFTVTLLHTPNIAPTFAQFLVPLSFNKLDMRDYLFHAYNVRVHNIRSFIKQHPIQSVETGHWRDLPGKRRQFRPKSTKKMLVELDKPFVWPETPTDLAKWDKDRHSALESARNLEIYGLKDQGRLHDERTSIADQAMRLLEGKEKWKGLDPSLAPATRGVDVRAR